MPFRSPLLAAALCGAALAQSVQPTCHDLAGITAIAQDGVVQLQLPGLTLLVEQRGQPVYAQSFGTHNAATVMPLASASKALAVAVAMRLVDRGLIRLDDPVSTYLPEWNTGLHAQVTMRHCLAHTTGLPPLHPLVNDGSLILRDVARQLASEPLSFTPGTAFNYGNVSMHVGGAVCEVVTGLDWQTLFQRELGTPLGMTSTVFDAFGPTQNPRIADGAASNAPDYRNFLEMLRQGGVFGGTRLLTEASVDQILSDNLGSLPVLGTPHPQQKPAGLGCWIEEVDASGRATRISMPGLFGFYGWIDRARDVTGCWVGNQFYVFTYPFVDRVWEVLDQGIEPLGVTCSGRSTPVCAQPPRLNARTWARDGLTDFGFRVDDAPTAALGSLFLAFGAPTAGVPFFDMLTYVPAGQSSFATMTTDALGSAVLPLRLPPGIPGAQFMVQGWWLDIGGCGQAGMLASRALSVTIQP